MVEYVIEFEEVKKVVDVMAVNLEKKIDEFLVYLRMTEDVKMDFSDVLAMYEGFISSMEYDSTVDNYFDDVKKMINDVCNDFKTKTDIGLNVEVAIDGGEVVGFFALDVVEVGFNETVMRKGAEESMERLKDMDVNFECREVNWSF